jgi:regulator of sirC expression with transglutaminase-like and TPR domain
VAEQRIRCQVCDALNTPGEKFCEVCGVELKAAAKPGGADVDSLLQELIETKTEAPADKKKGATLDIEEDIVDELLDSLVVDEGPGQAAPAVQEFECPICGATVQENAPECPQCHTPFAPVGQEAAPAAPEAEVVAPEEPPAEAPEPEILPEEAEAPPARRPVTPVPVEVSAADRAEEEAVAVTVTEEDLSKLRVSSGRLIDYVVWGTLGGIIVVFLGFRMWSLDNIASNPASLFLFLGVMAGGLAGGFGLFQLTTSAIAQGDRLVKAGQYDEAIAHYDRAIRMGSKPASAWTSKGVALKRLSKYEDALRCHNIALRLDPKNEIAWCNKGDIYFRLGQLPKAIECYDRALELRPRYAIAWNNKGAALARTGSFDEARKCHDRAVRLRPRYVAAWLNLGEVLAKLGKRAEAEKCLQRARSLTA